MNAALLVSIANWEKLQRQIARCRSSRSCRIPEEVWFGGSDVGIAAQLKSLNLASHERVVARVPGVLAIHDIARDGHALLTHENSRVISVALGSGQNQERDLKFTDWTLVNAISPDGRQVLLEEEGTGSHAGYDIYVRSTGVSPPVRIGEGHGDDFSLDITAVQIRQGTAVVTLKTKS